MRIFYRNSPKDTQTQTLTSPSIREREREIEESLIFEFDWDCHIFIDIFYCLSVSYCGKSRILQWGFSNLGLVWRFFLYFSGVFVFWFFFFFKWFRPFDVCFFVRNKNELWVFLILGMLDFRFLGMLDFRGPLMGFFQSWILCLLSCEL